MHWMSKHDRRALKQIVALLFAFAALAELASTKPHPLRVAVLWLLRAAEAIGRDFVSTMAADYVRPAPLLSLDEADDSIRLAHSFRALAKLLGDLIPCDRAPLLSNSRPVRDLMLNLRNLVADHPALAHSTLEPLRIDSS